MQPDITNIERYKISNTERSLSQMRNPKTKCLFEILLHLYIGYCDATIIFKNKTKST